MNTPGSLPWATTFGAEVPDDDTAIVVHRAFAAPPDLVWRAHTEPEHLKRWLGREDFPLTTCEMDVRVGGVYRWVFGTPDGHTMGVSGRFDEVARPRLMVTTEQFDDFPGPSVNTMVLSERADGGTSLQLTVRYPSREVRDGWAASGMTDGLSVGYTRLDELLGTIA